MRKKEPTWEKTLSKWWEGQKGKQKTLKPAGKLREKCPPGEKKEKWR